MNKQKLLNQLLKLENEALGAKKNSKNQYQQALSRGKIIAYREIINLLTD